MPTQLFYMNLALPNSKMTFRSTTENIQEFLDWGFLARTRPLIHIAGQRLQLGHFTSGARQNIISRLIAENPSLTLAHYLEAIDHSLSRQQALLDLKNHPQLKLKGSRRGSVYVSA